MSIGIAVSGNPFYSIAISGSQISGCTVSGSILNQNTADIILSISGNNLSLGSPGLLRLNSSSGYIGIPTLSGTPTGNPAGSSSGYLGFDNATNSLLVYNSKTSAWISIGNSSVQVMLASGTTQANSPSAPSLWTVVTGQTGSGALIIPTSYIGFKIDILNATSGNITVYPPSGAQWNSYGVNSGLNVASDALVSFFLYTSGQGYV